MTHRHDRTLLARGLARVEGEGGLYVLVHGDRVDQVRLDIDEPPRFFEALPGYLPPSAARAAAEAGFGLGCRSLEDVVVTAGPQELGTVATGPWAWFSTAYVTEPTAEPPCR